MNWIISLIIGGIVGWLASIVMKTNAQMGWIASVLVGIVGSMLGYWSAGLVGIAPAGGILRNRIGIPTPQRHGEYHHVHGKEDTQPQPS